MSLLRPVLLFLACGALVGSSAAAPAPGMDRAALLQAVAADLATHYGLADELAVDLLRPWSPPAAADDDAPVLATVVGQPDVLASSLLVRVRFTQGERILREDTLSLRAALWRDGLVAAAPIRLGEALSPRTVEIRRIDALRERGALPPSVLDQDYALAREVPAGRQLVWRDVVRRALVRRGGMVEVTAGGGTLLVTMKALAMQDGARGEFVRVRNLDSKREFTARVTAENHVEVRL